MNTINKMASLKEKFWLILSNGNNIQIGKKDKKKSNGWKNVKMIEYNNVTD